MLIICADDFGQNAPISEGILQLLALQRLQAVSCMVTEPACTQYAQQLLTFRPQVQIGLHLNLTHGQRALWQVLLQAYHLWPRSLLQWRIEIQKQLQCFKKIFGIWPDFIDGHQHVHQLPGVADALLDLVAELQIKPWFRSTYHRVVLTYQWLSSPKKVLLYGLGGRRFYRLLSKQGYPTNHRFAGDYNLSASVNYRAIFLQALGALNGDGVLMCHPGLPSDDATDPIRELRDLERQYFASESFLEDMKAYQVNAF